VTWQWSASANRYRDSITGRFLSKAEALGFVDASLSATGNVTDTLSSFVAGDAPAISPDDFRSAMRREIKDEYIRQYLLGRGGIEQMTAADWGSIGGSLAEQYKWLEGFYQQVAAGELSEAQVRSRTRMYINSAREAYERAQERVAENAGYDEVRWVLDPAVESCDDCIAFGAMGWQLIADDPYGGCIPGSGCTQCLTNCACHRDYRALAEE
jgi:hypothetical protein